MKKLIVLIILVMVSVVDEQTAQDTITFDPQKQLNAAQRLLSGNYGKAVTLGA